LVFPTIPTIPTILAILYSTEVFCVRCDKECTGVVMIHTVNHLEKGSSECRDSHSQIPENSPTLIIIGVVPMNNTYN